MRRKALILLLCCLYSCSSLGKEVNATAVSKIRDNDSAQSVNQLVSIFKDAPMAIYASAVPHGAYSFHAPTFHAPLKAQGPVVPVHNENIVIQKQSGHLTDSYGNKFLQTPQSVAYKTIFPQQFVSLQDLPTHLSQPLVAASPGFHFNQNVPQFSYGSPIRLPTRTVAGTQHFNAGQHSLPLVYAENTSLLSTPFQNRYTSTNFPIHTNAVQQPTNQKIIYSDSTPFGGVANFKAPPVKFQALQQEPETVLHIVNNKDHHAQNQKAASTKSVSQKAKPAQQVKITTIENGKKTTFALPTSPPIPHLLDLSLLEPLVFDNPIVPQVQHYLPRINYPIPNNLPQVNQAKKHHKEVLVQNTKYYSSPNQPSSGHNVQGERNRHNKENEDRHVPHKQYPNEFKPIILQDEVQHITGRPHYNTHKPASHQGNNHDGEPEYYFAITEKSSGGNEDVNDPRHLIYPLNPEEQDKHKGSTTSYHSDDENESSDEQNSQEEDEEEYEQVPQKYPVSPNSQYHEQRPTEQSHPEEHYVQHEAISETPKQHSNHEQRPTVQSHPKQHYIHHETINGTPKQHSSHEQRPTIQSHPEQHYVHHETINETPNQYTHHEQRPTVQIHPKQHYIHHETINGSPKQHSSHGQRPAIQSHPEQHYVHHEVINEPPNQFIHHEQRPTTQSHPEQHYVQHEAINEAPKQFSNHEQRPTVQSHPEQHYVQHEAINEAPKQYNNHEQRPTVNNHPEQHYVKYESIQETPKQYSNHEQRPTVQSHPKQHHAKHEAIHGPPKQYSNHEQRPTVHVHPEQHYVLQESVQRKPKQYYQSLTIPKESHVLLHSNYQPVPPEWQQKHAKHPGNAPTNDPHKSTFSFTPARHVEEKSNRIIIKDETPVENHTLREQMVKQMINEEENNEEDFDKAYKEAAYGFPAYTQENNNDNKDIYDPASYGVPKYHALYDFEDSPFAQYYHESDEFPKSSRLTYKEMRDQNTKDYFDEYQSRQPKQRDELSKMKDKYLQAYKLYKPSNYFSNGDNSKSKPQVTYKLKPSATKHKEKSHFAQYKAKPVHYEYNYSKDKPRDTYAHASKPSQSYNRNKWSHTQFVEPQFQYGFEPIPKLLDSELAAMASNDSPESEKPGTRKKIYKENWYIHKTSTAGSSPAS